MMDKKEPTIPDDLQHVKEINILNNDPPLDVSSEEAADFLATSPILLDPNSELSRLMKDLQYGTDVPKEWRYLMGLPAKEEAANLYCFLRRELERVVAGPVPDLLPVWTVALGSVFHASHLGASNLVSLVTRGRTCWDPRLSWSFESEAGVNHFFKKNVTFSVVPTRNASVKEKQRQKRDRFLLPFWFLKKFALGGKVLGVQERFDQSKPNVQPFWIFSFCTVCSCHCNGSGAEGVRRFVSSGPKQSWAVVALEKRPAHSREHCVVLQFDGATGGNDHIGNGEV